jgi:hypothetical protein
MLENFWSKYVKNLDAWNELLKDKYVPPSAPVGRSSLDEQQVSASSPDNFISAERAREQAIAESRRSMWEDTLNKLDWALGFAGGPVGAMTRPLTILRGAGKPIQVWHGTGVKWPAEPGYPLGRFNPAKVGSGEGAAAYGHAPGGYWAESRRVAEDYRRRLSGPETHLIDNKPIDLMDPRHAAADLLYSKGGDHGAAAASVNEGIQRITAEIRDLHKILDDPRYEYIGQRSPILQSIDFRETFLRHKLNKLEEMRRALLNPERLPTITVKRNEGALYEGQIHEDPRRFLDWDIPLSAQSPEVQRAVRELPYGNTPWIWGESYPMNALEQARAYYLRHPRAGALENPHMVEEVSKELAERGLPGIRYWDAMSRKAGQGTRNYVIFDPEIVEILKRYGLIPPAVIGAGAISKESSQ